MIGVDISSFQRGLRIGEVKDKGAEFVIIRATMGTRADQCAPGFYMGALAAGLPAGVYCYSYATTPEQADEEARFLIETLGGWPCPCGVWMDVETPEQLALPNEKLLETVRTWCAVIRAAGYVPGVYSSELSAWYKIKPEQLGDDVLVWVAHYGRRPDMACDLWQYTDQEPTSLTCKLDVDIVQSERFAAMVQAGFATDNNVGDDDHVVDVNNMIPDISGALDMLADFIKTDEFRANFKKFIERSIKKNECT